MDCSERTVLSSNGSSALACFLLACILQSMFGGRSLVTILTSSKASGYSQHPEHAIDSGRLQSRLQPTANLK